MKLLSVACLLLGVLLQQSEAAPNRIGCPFLGPLVDRYKSYRETCVEELKTSVAIRELAEAGRITSSDDPEMHCLIRCIGIKGQFYDDETGMAWKEVEEMGGFFRPSRQAMKKCTEALTEQQYGSDNCKKAYLRFECAINSFKG